MRRINSIAVFCGSRTGNNQAYTAASLALGHGLAAAGIRLVYGGGNVGLMGVLADAVLQAGGTVLGVIPDFLRRWEVAHDNLSEMQVTDSMHERKYRMFAEADAFLSMPGGIGTWDETIEVISWRQLRLHDKPILICDVAGSSRPLAALLESAIGNGFAAAETRHLYEFIDGVPAALERIRTLPVAESTDSSRL